VAISDRLVARIARDFPEPGSSTEVARLVEAASDSERIQAAIVLGSRGDLHRLQQLIELTKVDWRDTLVDGGLANEDWPQRLERELGG
jgi:hypothetical protein